jgi:acetylornithine deacetylase/succinyl-diaminopimelate desuccinylase-like protein
MMRLGDALAGPVDPKLLAGLASLRAKVPADFRRELEKLNPAVQAGILGAYFARQKHFDEAGKRKGVTAAEAEAEIRRRWEHEQSVRAQREQAQAVARVNAEAEKVRQQDPRRATDLATAFGGKSRPLRERVIAFQNGEDEEGR